MGQVIIILDACRNDPAGRANADNVLTESYTRSLNFDLRNKEVQAFVTLYATAVGHRAYEYTEKGQGYFTWALVEALKGGAADSRGEVTLASLLKYLQNQVPKRVGLDLGKDQRPFAIIEGYKAEELVISVSRHSSSEDKTVEVKSQVPQANEAARWNSIKDSTNPEDYRAFLKEFPNGRFAGQAKEHLAFVEAAAKEASSHPATGITIMAAANVFPKGALASKSFIIISRIAGDGLGASGAKVLVNGKDVSAQIVTQDDYHLKLEGHKDALNLKSGLNEVVVEVGGIRSQPYRFTIKF